MSDAIIIYLVPVLPFLSACAFLELWRRDTSRLENLSFAIAFGMTSLGYLVTVTSASLIGREAITILLSIFSIAAVAYNWGVMKRLGIIPPTKSMLIVCIIGCVCAGLIRGAEENVIFEVMIANSTLGVVFVIGSLLMSQIAKRSILDNVILAIWVLVAAQSFIRPPLSFVFDNLLFTNAIVDIHFHAVLYWVLGFVGLGLSAVLFAASFKVYVADLHEHASMDGLTNLPNRKKFESSVSELLRPNNQSDAIFSLVVCDLDNFKGINDRWGHQTGDHVLRIFADLLKKSTRASDIVGRIGGEEFCVLVKSPDANAGYSLAERVRSICPTLVDETIPSGVRISSSFGVSIVANGESYASAFARADRALYEAKHAGRNRVVLAEETSSTQTQNEHELPSIVTSSRAA
ncbi:MAG: diguanylate cyclase [Erythrobacter sp.]